MNQQIDFFDLFMIILNSEIIKNNHEYSMMIKKNSEIFTIILIHSFLYYFHDFISFWNSHFIFILVFRKAACQHDRWEDWWLSTSFMQWRLTRVKRLVKVRRNLSKQPTKSQHLQYLMFESIYYCIQNRDSWIVQVKRKVRKKSKNHPQNPLLKRLLSQ